MVREGDSGIPMHPMSIEEHIVRCSHVYNQLLVQVLYITEAGLDGDFFPMASIPFDRIIGWPCW